MKTKLFIITAICLSALNTGAQTPFTTIVNELIRGTQNPTTKNVASLTADSIVLNPTTWTRLAQYGSGIRGCTIRMSGRWIPGAGHPSWDANGSSRESLNGVNKWCVLIQVYAGTDLIGTIHWTSAQNGVMSIGNFGFPTAVIAFMNDDGGMYDDNTNDAGNPMTASVSLF